MDLLLSSPPKLNRFIPTLPLGSHCTQSRKETDTVALLLLCLGVGPNTMK